VLVCRDAITAAQRRVRAEHAQNSLDVPETVRCVFPVSVQGKNKTIFFATTWGVTQTDVNVKALSLAAGYRGSDILIITELRASPRSGGHPLAFWNSNRIQKEALVSVD
jgi:hypothetical protein